MKLIFNTPSSMKIKPSKLIRKGLWQFSAIFCEMDGNTPRIFQWFSVLVDNPTQGHLLKQARKFIAFDDSHPYLEGIEIRGKKREIHMQFGS